MKHPFTFLFLLFATHLHAQLTPGEWKGRFTDKTFKYPISLKVVAKGDSSLEITSYTSSDMTLDGKPIVERCSVLYQFAPPDSLILEETALLNKENRNILAGNCFQKMYLKIIKHKKQIELRGTWIGTTQQCAASSGGL